MRAFLTEELAYAMRYAENAYLDSNLSDDSEKGEVVERVKQAQLSPQETEEFEALCDSMGV